MKHVNSIMLGFCVLFIFSCNDDDPADLIIGKWKLKSLVITQCDDPLENQSLSFTNGCLTQSGFTICQELSFSNDKSYIFTTVITGPSGVPETDTETGKYTINDDKITLCTGVNFDDCDEGTFSVTDNTLNINAIANDDSGCLTNASLVK